MRLGYWLVQFWINACGIYIFVGNVSETPAWYTRNEMGVPVRGSPVKQEGRSRGNHWGMPLDQRNRLQYYRHYIWSVSL